MDRIWLVQELVDGEWLADGSLDEFRSLSEAEDELRWRRSIQKGVKFRILTPEGLTIVRGRRIL